jgi:hypothetical protein
MRTYIPGNSNRMEIVIYEDDKQLLTIEFKRGGRYEYENVPPEVYNSLIVAKSAGQFFNENIRDNFEFTKIS